MFGLVHIGKIATALFIGALLMTAAVPICQMAVCDNMSVPMPMSSAAALSAACAAPISSALASGTIAQSLRSATLKLVAAFVAVALAVPLRNPSFALSGDRAESPPPENPLGVRILI